MLSSLNLYYKFQVLISIQSLILCSEPYYNEPGYERMYGTPQGESESLKYSEEVFKNNLKYAIIGQLLNPPEGFEQVCLFFQFNWKTIKNFWLSLYQKENVYVLSNPDIKYNPVLIECLVTNWRQLPYFNFPNYNSLSQFNLSLKRHTNFYSLN